MSSYVSINYDGDVDIDLMDYIDEIDTDDLVKELAKRQGVSTPNGRVQKCLYTMDNHFTTEEVKEVYDFIIGSYHYDVFKGELDEKVD